MNDLRFILNMPIEIEGIGSIYPFTIEDYALYGQYLNVLSVTRNLILQQIDVKEKEYRTELEDKLKNFDVLCGEITIIETLIKLLSISFKIEVSDIIYYSEYQSISMNNKIINRDNYDFVRNSIIKINNIRLPKQAKTKELQDWFDKSYEYKNGKNKDSGGMEDVITSIMAFAGYTPDEIKKMTVYQINKIIERLNKISEYDANIQFLCAGAEKIKLEHWSMHIPQEDEDRLGSSFEDFKGMFSGILN